MHDSPTDRHVTVGADTADAVAALDEVERAATDAAEALTELDAALDRLGVGTNEEDLAQNLCDEVRTVVR